MAGGFYVAVPLNLYGFLVVSVFAVSVLVVSVLAGAVVDAESTLVLSDPLLAVFEELQLVAIAPIIVATSAKLKICFFMS